MGLWIGSQDRTKIARCDSLARETEIKQKVFDYDRWHIIKVNGVVFGRYSSEENAKKAFKDLQKYLTDTIIVPRNFVEYLPQEDENGRFIEEEEKC